MARATQQNTGNVGRVWEPEAHLVGKELTPMEKRYWSMIKAQAGTLFLKGKPGMAKSAILRTIASKLGMRYLHINLAMISECDLGVYPILEDWNGTKSLSFATPKWAAIANEAPTLINFEELNRCRLVVQNACLQILNERRIGSDFQFNENAFMCSCGNEGESDNTSVEEFDRAMKTRLITQSHHMTVQEWVDGYAKQNVLPVITNYLLNNAEEYYKSGVEGGTGDSFACPRTWTFLSKYIEANHGREFSIGEIIPSLKENGCGYVGPAITKFIRYCENMVKITMKDLMKDYDSRADVLKTLGKDVYSELLASLKAMNFKEFKKKEIDNVVKFLATLERDELVGYLVHVIDSYDSSDDDKANAYVFRLRDEFRSVLQKVQGMQ